MRLYPAYIAYILNCRWTREAQGWANVPSLPKETRDAVIAEMLGLLKTLVDQWIESGKNIRDANVENPWERSIAWTSPLRPNPISTVLLLYAESNPRVASIDSNSRMRIDILPIPFDAKYPLIWARDRAIYEFVMLLDSPMRERLFRCDACATYYVRAKAPRKDRPIKRGTFCKKCRNKGGIRRMADRRNQQKKERIGWAADAWPMRFIGLRFMPRIRRAP